MSERPANLHPDFPVTPEGHFYLRFYALLARVLANLKHLSQQENARLSALPTQYPFLEGYESLLVNYAQTAVENQQEWWTSQIALLEEAYEGHLPLRTLPVSLGLRPAHIDLLLAVGLVEENIAFGSLFAYLHDPLPARSPSMGILGVLLGEPGTPLPDTWDVCRPLVNNNLVYVQNLSDPRAEWLIRVPAALWDALRGRPLVRPVTHVTLQAASKFPALAAMVLPEQLGDQLAELPPLMNTSQISALVVRGLRGTGRRTLIGALARSLDRGVLLCESLTDENRKLIGPLATLTNTVPVLRMNPGPGETADVAPLPGYTGVVGITLGKSGGLGGEVMNRAYSVTLPAPDPEARQRLWERTGVPIWEAAAPEIYERFLVTAGVIHRAAELARTYAQLDSRAEIVVSDVQSALRSLNRQSLDTLATRLDAVRGWSDLVVSNLVQQELDNLAIRCRVREQLRDRAGDAFARTLNRGVRAMFTGPSGTGKTLAGRALAAELQLDLYRIDLAAVVNKYIGETERNLNEVLSRAEELDVILLLDEGDALMTRRTDVNNANDRYANLETNYLLQRLETYEGIVIITTNAAQRIDSAFMRRLDVVIDFGKPSKADRLSLWRMHLPKQHNISDPFLDRVATRGELTGGQIRNAALFLTLMATRRESRADDEALETALRHEYRKAGLAYPFGENAAAPPDGRQVRAQRRPSTRIK